MPISTKNIKKMILDVLVKKNQKTNKKNRRAL
jgi:hypothetical protein